MDEEDEHSPSEFYYPEDLETFDVETETGITESQEAIDDFINQKKSANTNKKTATDMNTPLRCMEANGMKNEKIESLPASELDHLFSKFFWTHARKMEKSTSQQQLEVTRSTTDIAASSTKTTLIDQSSDPLLSSTAPPFTRANIGSIGCTFQIFHGNVKIVQNERKRRVVIDSDGDDWLWSYFYQLCPVLN